jgi:SAM-dependent methyltransferase
MKKNWYDHWFNSPEYLEVYKHRNETDAEKHINFITSAIDLKPSAKILDLACGAGRHSVLLARKGYVVTAVDLSDVLLNEAIRIASMEQLKINFVKSDIRYLQIDDSFDLIINLFTSFGYFQTDDENFVLFQKAYQLLKQGGYFIFDFFNKHHLLKNLKPLTEENGNGKKTVQKRFVREGRIEKIIEILSSEGKKVYNESVKLYSPTELKNKLIEIGFEIINIYGDFECNKFDLDNSERFITVCRK